MEFEPDVPWETGARYWYGWVAWIAITATAIVLNVAVIGFTSYNKRIRQAFVAPAVRYLAYEDLGFVSVCFVQCLSNISGGSFSGTWRACQFQAIYTLAFFLATGYSLVFYAYVCKQQIKSFKNVDRERQCLKFHVVSWSWCLLIGVIGTFISKPQLMQSGLLCMVDWRRWWNWLTFMALGVITVAIMLGVEYHHIIKAVKISQDAVASNNSTGKDTMRALLIRITLFVTVYVVSAAPLLISSLQNIITGRPSSAELDVIFGIAAHSQSVANPILYFVLHPHHRREVIRTTRKFLRLSVRPSSDFWKSGSSSDEPGNTKRSSAVGIHNSTTGTSSSPRTSAMEHEIADGRGILRPGSPSKPKATQFEHAETPPIIVVQESQISEESPSNVSLELQRATTESAANASHESQSSRKSLSMPLRASHTRCNAHLANIEAGDIFKASNASDEGSLSDSEGHDRSSALANEGSDPNEHMASEQPLPSVYIREV